MIDKSLGGFCFRLPLSEHRADRARTFTSLNAHLHLAKRPNRPALRFGALKCRNFSASRRLFLSCAKCILRFVFSRFSSVFFYRVDETSRGKSILYPEVRRRGRNVLIHFTFDMIVCRAADCFASSCRCQGTGGELVIGERWRKGTS
jgi:hypothetical protein